MTTLPRNGWYFALLLACVLGAAVATGLDLLVHVAYLLGGVLLLGFLWGRLSLLGLELRSRPTAARLQVGELLVERFELRNRGPLPLFPLELRDLSELPGRERLRALVVPPFGTATWTVATTCRARGAYRLGPVELVTVDPFGCFRARRRTGLGQTVLVLPATAPLPGLVAPGQSLPGGARPQSLGVDDSPQVATVRDYAAGDPLSRIHWPSSARTGRLIVKQLEHEPTADAWVALDMSAAPQRGLGQASTEEAAVAAAASVARRLLEAGRAVGLIARGDRRVALAPARGEAQLGRILEELATLRARGDLPLVELLRADLAALRPASTVVAVTPDLDPAWPDALASLERAAPVAVLVEPSTFGGRESSLLLIGQLASTGVPTYLVKRGMPLTEALAP